MNVFENLIKIDNEGNVTSNQWIEWDHFNIPNNPPMLREMMRTLMAIFKHCKKCTALDGCYMLDNNRPAQPLHPNCDCTKINKSYSTVKSKASTDFPIEKLTKYIFNGDEQSKGKQNIFSSWGYNINDSSQIKLIMEYQAKSNYLAGNYVLKNLDDFGQRIAIPITLNGNTFYSGWMLEPDGKIRNTTPFGGWLK